MKSSLDEPMPDMSYYPFQDHYEAIRWLNTHCPTRMISKDPLEDTRGNPPYDEQALYAQTLWAVEATLRNAAPDERLEWYQLFRAEERAAWADVAARRLKYKTDEALSIGIAQLKRRMRALNENLAQELRRRALIPPK